MDGVWAWGIEVVVQLQQMAGLAAPMNLITFTGSTEFFLLILPVIYWSVNRQLGVRLAVALLLSIWVGSVLKIALHGPRPYWIDPQVQLLTGPEATFGLPSIHTLNGVVMWTLLAQAVGRWWGWVIAVLLMALAGVARVYLGVHFPSDVLAGWLLGLLILVALWRWREPFVRWYGHFSIGKQFLLGVIISVIFLLVGVLAQLISAATLDTFLVWPEAMRLRAAEYMGAFALTDVVTVAGFTVGLTGGVLLCRRRECGDVTAPLRWHIVRYVVGVIGVLLLWQGLDLLFTPLAAETSLLGYALRYIRYGLIGLWIFGLAPLLFARRQPAAQPTNF